MGTTLVTGANGLVGYAFRKMNNPDFIFVTREDADLTNYAQTKNLFERIHPEKVIHLVRCHLFFFIAPVRVMWNFRPKNRFSRPAHARRKCSSVSNDAGNMNAHSLHCFTMSCSAAVNCGQSPFRYSGAWKFGF